MTNKETFTVFLILLLTLAGLYINQLTKENKELKTEREIENIIEEAFESVADDISKPFDKYGELMEWDVELCNSLRNQNYIDAIYEAREYNIVCYWEYDLEGNRTQDSLDAVEWIEKNI